MSEISDVTVCGNVKRKGNDKYKIKFMPTIKGNHQLHIKVDDQHIGGSPFSVAVKLPVKKFGTPIQTIGGLNKPWGVMVKKQVIVT